MFGGIEMAEEAPRNAGVDNKAEIRIACKKKLWIYRGTPGTQLRICDGEQLIFCQLVWQSLSIQATSTPSKMLCRHTAAVLAAK